MKQILVFVTGEEKEFLRICPDSLLDPRIKERIAFYKFLEGKIEDKLKDKINPTFSVKFENGPFCYEGLIWQDLGLKLINMAFDIFNPDKHTPDCKSH